MLKKIDVKQLRTGMFLHELCGSWMEHPFWRSAFMLKDPKDIELIVNSAIREVWIDTGKGVDVLGGQSREALDDKINKEFLSLTITPAKQVERAAMAEELKRAAKILSKSKEAVASMFHEVRMGKTLNAKDAMPLVEEISGSVLRNPGAIISLVRIKNKDEYTYMHSVAVCALMIGLARQMDLSETETRDAGLAGLLHDAGKMMVADVILNKPGNLTNDEFMLMKSHPEQGHKFLLGVSNISEVALDVCLHHHEKIDGSGYPHHLVDEQISKFAKMGAVCDVYDAITSNRPYKNGWDPGESLRKMAEWSRGHFDERIFHAFVKSLGIYPIGSLVRLQSGRLGIVIDQTEKSLLTPKVRVFFSTKSKVHLPPEVIDLSRPGVRDKVVAPEDPAKWKFTGLDKLIGELIA